MPISCSGAIAECLQCRFSDCVSSRAPNPIRVDDYIRGDRIFDRPADPQALEKAREKKRQYNRWYQARRRALKTACEQEARESEQCDD